MTEEQTEKAFLKRFGKWAPVLGSAWILLNILVPLALLRMPAVQQNLIALRDKLPLHIPGIG